jgi:phosphate:Na+ symporter
VQDGMTRAFGADLHKVISVSTGNRLTAFLSGIGVTAMLQSSTATNLIIAGFCSRQLMTLTAGLAVILGAGVGTTLVAQVLTFDLSWLDSLLIIAGFLMLKLYRKGSRASHVGKTLIGLGLMLLALGIIQQAAVQLEHSETLKMVLQSLEHDPVLSLVIVGLLTWFAHASLATVLMVASFVNTGILPVHVGLVMVLGANLGGVFASLIPTLRDSPEAGRVSVGNLITRFIGVVMIMPFMGLVEQGMEALDPNHMRMIVNFHTAFNVALAVVFLPFTGRMADLCTALIRDRRDRTDPRRPRYLDDTQLTTPSVALSSAMRETLRMADIVQGMLEDTITALKENNDTLVQDIRDRDDIIDSLHKAVKMYMAKISQESLSVAEAHHYVRILSFSSNLENVGDMIDKSMMEMASKKIRDKTMFSEAGWREIQAIHGFVVNTMRLSQSVFVSEDVRLARQIVEDKDRLREAESRASASHLERIREGNPATIATSSLHLDIIRDYRRINSYMATVAFPILEEKGQLRNSLKPLKKKNRKPKPEPSATPAASAPIAASAIDDPGNTD